MSLNPRREHDRDSFYKHTTAATAQIILASATLRWSAPGIFNDPFDVPKKIFDGIDDVALQHAVVEKITMLIDSPVLPDAGHHSLLTRMLLATFARANATAKQELLECASEFRAREFASSGLAEFRKLWDAIYREHRIVCFTERWDSASMWDRYSDGHRGVILEFACLDELDSAWLVAKPVRYTDEPLRLNTPAGLAELLFYDVAYSCKKILHEYTHTKTKDWEYEKEWRVASWQRAGERGEYFDYPFHSRELKSVILGAKTDEGTKRVITELLAEKFPHAELWQTSLDGSRRVTRAPLILPPSSRERRV